MMIVSTVAIRKAMWVQLLSDPSTQVIRSLRTFWVAVLEVWGDDDDVDDLRPTVSPSTKTPEWYILTTDRWIDSAFSLPMKLSTTQMPYFSKSRTTHWHTSMSHSIFFLIFKIRVPKCILILDDNVVLYVWLGCGLRVLGSLTSTLTRWLLTNKRPTDTPHTHLYRWEMDV